MRLSPLAHNLELNGSCLKAILARSASQQAGVPTNAVRFDALVKCRYYCFKVIISFATSAAEGKNIVETIR